MNRFSFASPLLVLGCLLCIMGQVVTAGETVWLDDVSSNAAVARADTHGLIFSVDYLNWQPSTRGNDFAVSEDGTGVTLGSGRIHDVKFDREPGMRTRLGYQTATGWSVSGAYTYFDTFGSQGALRPAGVGQLFATQSHPDGNEEAESAFAETSFDYSVFDLIIERRVFQNQFTDTRIFGGIRWANIGQQTDVRYDGRDFVNALVSKRSETHGAGLRMGTESSWLLAGGFRLYGQISGGMLFSEISTSHFETNFDDTVVLVDVVHGQDGSVPFLETAVGVGWEYGHFSVLAGYEMQNWFGLHDRSMFVDDIHEATYANISEDLLLSGLFVRAGVSW